MQGVNLMRQQNKRYLLTSFLAVLFIGTGFLEYSTSQTPVTEPPVKNKTAEFAAKEKNIPIQSAISHVREPDGSSNIIIDIVIGNEFEGILPDDIHMITVTGPKGDLSLTKDDFNYSPQLRDFWIRIPGIPETGLYTFTVSSDNRSGSATDTQSDLRTLPSPDTGTFRPAEGETITMKSPHFSWGGVDAEAPLYYRIDIKDSEMRRSADWIQFMLDLPMVETPGTRFEYCNGASFLLSAIIQKATGITAHEFAVKHLFNHLGIDDLNWPANPQGVTIGWGEMRLKPRDMAKIGYMMLKEGNWQGRQTISRNWVKESTRAHIKAGGYDYGYQWWRGKTIANNQIIDAFWAWGHGGQFIFVLPALDSVVVFTAKHRENPGYSERAFGMLTQHIIPAVIPHPSLEKTAALDREVMDAYVGKY